ncbi:MAG: VCBS repeat-containing protein [Balneolaceae bacterium]|nr:VCBS repeat-containing protein [Balneolaceae bacterium]
MASRFFITVIALGLGLTCISGGSAEPLDQQDYSMVTQPKRSFNEQLVSKSPEDKEEERMAPETLFTKLSADQTGIDFINTITETSDFNNLLYPFMYNGGGVAIGDINNNGYPDIFLTGNMVSSRLYLNNGNMQFEDITESAGIVTETWVTGVSMVDINNNGYLDIYLSVVSPEDAPAKDRANLLFINNGDETFTEMAAEFNLDDTSHTTHAVFLDYNRNGLLDLYLLNHSPGSFSRDMADSQHITVPQELSTSFDRLYKNNGDGTFSDVSVEAGILEVTGFGLGVVVADLNRNGWPDIYVSNDISPNDVLYINNKDGTFTNRASQYLKHTSYAGMGIDIADFNNNGWPDIYQTDMVPENYHDRKTMSYGVDFDNFKSRINQGFYHSYSQNTLQLNNGVDQEGHLAFSEVARMAGVAYTEWSWSALFGDFNNSGYKDLMVTNGYPKAVNDFDYLVEVFYLERSGTDGATWDKRYELFQELHDIRLPNYLFRNNGDIMFKDVSEEWGFVESNYSYGAAYADLNNNGNLDLVINNLNSTASVYQNNTGELFGNHYLSVELVGSSGNRQGIGAEVVINAGGVRQHLYHNPYRGYQSTMDPRLHFGLGQNSKIESLEVFWPDGRYQRLTDIQSNQRITVDYSDSAENPGDPFDPEGISRKFDEVTDEVQLIQEHRQNRYNEFNIQPLLHRQLSMMGPRIAVGDVNGNGLDDLYIGGSADFPGTLYLQNDEGTFEEFNRNQPWLNDQSHEDLGAVFFDANGNGHMDLYVTSGGYMFSPAEDALLDRLYINRGDGRFFRDRNALPWMFTSSSVVVPGDFNGNGQMDLFVGGRLTPLNYPNSARSYILENNNGRFRDVTEDVAPDLVKPGLITDALWIDFDGDGHLDLVTTGKWLPVQFYRNEGGRLTEVTKSVIEEPQRGWWYSLQKGDFTNNGFIDIIAGNLGLNDTFTTSEEKKFGIFAGELYEHMTTDLIYSVEEDGTHYPFFGRAKFDRAMRSMDEKFPTFSHFSKASFSDIFDSEKLEESIHYQVDTFSSMILQNQGGGSFSGRDLPEMAQISPVKGMIAHDVDRDGNLDIILAGNIFEIHPDVARSDAGNGLWLKGNGNGDFEPVHAFESGFFAPGNVKDLKLINTPSGQAVVVANNRGRIQVFQLK